MTKPISEGDVVEIIGSTTIPEGTVVTVCFAAPNYNGHKVWAIDEEFKNSFGGMSNLCLERIMRRIEDDGKELCTSWEHVKKTIGFVPDGLVEVA